MLYKVDKYLIADKIIEKPTYVAQITSNNDYETEYYKLCGVDENNNEQPICAFDNPREVRTSLAKIDDEFNCEYYNLYKVNEKLINNDSIEEYQFIAMLPSKKNEEIKYYSLRVLDKFGIETELMGFRTLEAAKEHKIYNPKDNVKYNYYDTIAILEDETVTENRTLIKKIQNTEHKKRSKHLI